MTDGKNLASSGYRVTDHFGLIIGIALVVIFVVGIGFWRSTINRFRPEAIDVEVIPQPDATTEYQFGIVPQFEPRHLAGVWVPILDELNRRTGLKFIMTGSPHIPDFEVNFQQGLFDFAYMNPYHSLLAFQSQGYEPLVRDGGRYLSGILVVPKDSPIHSVDELAGESVAFPAPNALGASMLVRADLATVHNVKVKPRYVKTHSSVYTEVLLGRVKAGGGVMATLKQQPQEIQDGLRILYTTREMAPHPIVGHPRVPEEHREAVRQAFLDMGATEAWRSSLARIPIRQVTAASTEDYRVIGEWGLDAFFQPPQ